MGETRDSEERGIIEIFNKDLMVDRCGHENDFQVFVLLHEFFELKQEQVAVD